MKGRRGARRGLGGLDRAGELVLEAMELLPEQFFWERGREAEAKRARRSCFFLEEVAEGGVRGDTIGEQRFRVMFEGAKVGRSGRRGGKK